MKLHPFRLAEVPVPGSFAAAGGDRRTRIPIVVTALLVDHPRGRVLIDAGLPAASRPGPLRLLERLVPAYRTVPGCMRDAGIATDEVSDLVLTHMHFDHVGAVPAFRQARVLVGPGEVATTRRRFAGLLGYAGAASARSHGLAEAALHAWDEGGADFPKAHDLFGDGAIILLPTPGHTLGSISVLIRTNPPTLHIGDAAYTLDALDGGSGNGALLGRPVDADPELARQSLDRLAGLASRLGARVLPSHDPAAWS